MGHKTRNLAPGLEAKNQLNKKFGNFEAKNDDNPFGTNKSISKMSRICVELRRVCDQQPLWNQHAICSNATGALSLLNTFTLFTLFTFSLFHGPYLTTHAPQPTAAQESAHRAHRAKLHASARSTISNSERGAPFFVRGSAPNELKRKRTMNRRELFAALAATAVAGEALAFAQNSPDTTPAAAPPAGTAPGTTPAVAAVMGSKVFDWNKMVDKPTKTGSVWSVCSAPTATLENLKITSRR